MSRKESVEPETPPAGGPLDLGAEARLQDPDRWLCTLFAPAAFRDLLWGLLLFNQALARIPEAASQPMAAMIRYQWWRDAIEAAAAGRPRRHPVVLALARGFAAGRLDPVVLLAMVDARESEIEALPPADLAALEAYAAATAGALQVALAQALDGPATPWAARARSIGTAFGLTGIVRAVGFQASRNRLLLPQKLLDEAGVTPEAVLAAAATEGLATVTGRITARALALLDEARRDAGRIPAGVRAALLPAVLARHYARKLEALGGDAARAAFLARPASAPLRLLGAHLRGRV
jgi:phytoene synthase